MKGFLFLPIGDADDGRPALARSPQPVEPELTEPVVYVRPRCPFCRKADVSDHHLAVDLDYSNCRRRDCVLASRRKRAAHQYRGDHGKVPKHRGGYGR